MTAVEWLVEKTFTDFGKSVKSNEIKMAKEMEKQQIIDAHLIGLITSLEMEATKQATEYFNETYGSKGSDETKSGEFATFKTSSKTEISDEEIEKASKYWNETTNPDMWTYKLSWKAGAKWYREQLKKKQ